MFFAYETGHGLPHDPFKAIVAPRPIGWITSMSLSGEINLAPYSYFNGVCSRPRLVCFSSEGRKDSVTFIEETKEFVCNLATWDLRDAMNLTSAPFPRGVDEMRAAGLTPAPSRLVKPPRVAEAPAALECRAWRILDLPGENNTMVIGEVVGVHIDDAMIVNGRLDVTLYKPLARLGYRDYAAVAEVFPLTRPR